MNIATRMTRTICFVLLIGSMACFTADAQPVEDRAREAEKMEDIREEAARAKHCGH